MLTTETFDEALYETVDLMLTEILGEKVSQALRFYVDLRSALKTPTGFFSVISDLVGPRQAVVLKEHVLSRLYKRYGLEYKPSGKNVVDELANLRSLVGSR